MSRDEPGERERKRERKRERVGERDRARERERERVGEREWGEGGEMDVLHTLETIRLVVLSTQTLAYGNSMIA